MRRMKARKAEVRSELINRFGKKRMEFKKVMARLINWEGSWRISIVNTLRTSFII